jgi:hypothetical protein
MIGMFWNAESFSQNISGWNVANVMHIGSMFLGATTLEQSLDRLQVTSFFEGEYRHMSPADRKQVFSAVFPWPRRKAFVMFLAGNGYLPCASVRRVERRVVPAPGHDNSSDSVPTIEGGQGDVVAAVPAVCDRIFDVEDIARYICLFL